MSTYIQNQPVFFGDPTLCTSDEMQFNQLVDNTDTTQFQFEISPCDVAEQLIPDPIFQDPGAWTLYDGWSINDGLLCATGETDPTLTAKSDFEFTDGGYFQVTLVVDSISLGGEFNVLIGGTFLGSITTIGTYTFYGFATTFLGNSSLVIAPAVDGSEICLSSVQAFEVLTNFIFPIYEAEGGVVATISYADNPEYFSFVDNTLTVTINWAELEVSNGCYNICLLDPCVNTDGQNYPANIINCGFTDNADGWTYETGFGAGWVYSADNMIGTFQGDGLVGNDLWQTEVFSNFTTTYCITIGVMAISGTLNVYFGTNLITSISTPGNHTVCGIPSDDLGLLLRIGSGTVTIGRVCPISVSPSDYVCDMASNNFKLSDYSDSCTILINACNNENGLGFNFNNSGFSPRIRLEAKLKQAKYPQERSIQEDSLGKKSVNYFSGKKAKNLAIDLQPEYVHDFLRLLAGFDNVYLDGVLYFVEDDEYAVDYGDQDNIGKVNILVSTRTQNVKNINCSGIENVCNLGENLLLQADDLTQNITLVTGETILING